MNGLVTWPTTAERDGGARQQVGAENDRLQPLWESSDVLQPSIYLAQWPASVESQAELNAHQVNATVGESIRLARQVAEHPSYSSSHPPSLEPAC